MKTNPPKMMPGQEPYTEKELKTLYALIGDAAKGDEGETFDKGAANALRNH